MVAMAAIVALVSEHPRVATAGMQSELHESCVELGTARRQADVAREREVHAGADGCAVDGCDGGKRRPCDAHEPVVHAQQPLALRGAEVGQVSPRAERGRCAGDDDRTDVAI
jgi:hypothetical protein